MNHFLIFSLLVFIFYSTLILHYTLTTTFCHQVLNYVNSKEDNLITETKTEKQNPRESLGVTNLLFVFPALAKIVTV